MNYNLNLSDTSFTNKEFNDVYPELLGKAKELSYKWDPTVSNESDPGVTLIKEIALALDKINYASDKNALETMPFSVTQERTSRQLFQLFVTFPKLSGVIPPGNAINSFLNVNLSGSFWSYPI